MAKDPYQDVMDAVDKTGGTGSMSGDRRLPPQQPLPRPKFGWPWTPPPQPEPKMPSKAPYGMEACVKGDIGKYRQQEAEKVFRKGLGGRSISNPLKYRTPDTAIDAKFGPGDKVC